MSLLMFCLWSDYLRCLHVEGRDVRDWGVASKEYHKVFQSEDLRIPQEIGSKDRYSRLRKVTLDGTTYRETFCIRIEEKDPLPFYGT